MKILEPHPSKGIYLSFVLLVLQSFGCANQDQSRNENSEVVTKKIVCKNEVGMTRCTKVIVDKTD